MNLRTGTGWAALAVAVLTSGCASSLSTLQTGRTLEPGHVRIGVGMGVYVPAGQAVKLLGEGVDLSKRAADAVAKNQAPTWTEADQQTLLTSGISLAVMPVSSLLELTARVGVAKDFDVGLKYSTNAIRLDGKYRLLHDGKAEDPNPLTPDGEATDVAVLVGASKFLFKNPVTDLLEYVKLGDFSRWDVEGAVIVSHDFNKYVGLYAAPKYTFSRTTMDERLVQLTQEASGVVKTEVSMPTTVDCHFAGVSAGVRAGIPQVSAFLELTGGYTFSKAVVLGAERDLGGVTLYPAAGLAVSL